MARLSTHALDTENGIPAQGVYIEFYRGQNDQANLVKSVVTNIDGRTDELLLDSDAMQEGDYQLIFHIGEYFAKRSATGESAGFINAVPINFTIADATANYHIPLVASQWSYSRYRGS